MKHWLRLEGSGLEDPGSGLSGLVGPGSGLGDAGSGLGDPGSGLEDDEESQADVSGVHIQHGIESSKV